MTDLHDLATDHTLAGTQTCHVGGDHPAGSQIPSDTHRVGAPGTISDDDHKTSETKVGRVVVGSLATPPTKHDTAPTGATSEGWLELRIWAEMFEDAQKSRIAATNRAERGGVDPDVYETYTEALETAEKICGLHMRKCYRRIVPEPIRQWQDAMGGVGEHLLARLLGHLGHPVHATPHHWEGTGSKRTLIADEPYARTVGQLWQYCGHGAPGRIKKGATFDELAAMGSPKLKMVVHLIAEAIVKSGVRKYPDAPAQFDPDSRHAITAYGQVYLDSRRATVDKLHTVECVRCGPSGKPAQPGSPWSAGHQQAHALRIVGKELLRDMWIVAGGAA